MTYRNDFNGPYGRRARCWGEVTPPYWASNHYRTAGTRRSLTARQRPPAHWQEIGTSDDWYGR